MSHLLPGLLEDSPDSAATVLLVGENGAGKSQLLDRLAHHYARLGRPVLAIANTIYDRFTVRGRAVSRLSARSGQSLPTRTMKKAISTASNESLSRLRHISTTLQYCGYDGRIGFDIRDFKRRSDEQYASLLNGSELTTDELEDILALCNKYVGLHEGGGPLWLDFTTLSFDTVNRSLFARFIRWEKTLIRARILSRIDLILSRDGITIPMRAASSGELSLIATLVFVSASIQPGAIILIDEPENSLHPRWQREYVSRLLDLVYLYQPYTVIATHAPLLVSGAYSQGNAASVAELRRGHVVRQITGPPGNLEGLLWTTFGILSPENHFLSEELVRRLNELNQGKMTLDELNLYIDDLLRASYDERQRSFLARVRDIAGTVAEAADHGQD